MSKAKWVIHKTDYQINITSQGCVGISENIVVWVGLLKAPTRPVVLSLTGGYWFRSSVLCYNFRILTKLITNISCSCSLSYETDKVFEFFPRNSLKK